jgi:hypothetical protein
LLAEKEKLISSYVRENSELELKNSTLIQNIDLMTAELVETKHKYDNTIESLNLKNNKLSEK